MAATGTAHLATTPKEQIYWLPTALIHPDPNQPRKYFDPGKMRALKASIELHGVRQPGEVAPRSNGGYDLVDGERRFRVCCELGIPFPVRISDKLADPKARFVASVVSNFAREPHTPLETAKAIEKMLSFGMSMIEVAASLSMSTAQANTYRLILEIHPKLQPLVEPNIPSRERMSLTHIRILVRIPKEAQVAEWEKIRAAKLSSRKAQHALLLAVQRHGGPRQLYTQGRPPKPSDWMKRLTTYIAYIVEQGELLAKLDLIAASRSAKAGAVADLLKQARRGQTTLERVIKQIEKAQG